MCDSRVTPISTAVTEGASARNLRAASDLSRGYLPEHGSRTSTGVQSGKRPCRHTHFPSLFPRPIVNSTCQSSNESSDSIANILPLVDAVVASLERRLPVHVSREDLASAGKVALIEALRRFDGPEQEARAYCFIRVRGAVYDELRRLDPLSRRTRTQITLVQRAAADLESALGRTPTTGELSAATGLRGEKLRQLERINTATAVRSLQEEGEGGEPIHQIADPAADTPARVLECEDMALTVREALGRLPANQAQVMQRYHFEDATLEQIAEEMGISRERVRQLRMAAEKKLKADLMIMAAWSAMAAAA